MPVFDFVLKEWQDFGFDSQSNSDCRHPPDAAVRGKNPPTVSRSLLHLESVGGRDKLDPHPSSSPRSIVSFPLFVGGRVSLDWRLWPTKSDLKALFLPPLLVLLVPLRRLGAPLGLSSELMAQRALVGVNGCVCVPVEAHISIGMSGWR